MMDRFLGQRNRVVAHDPASVGTNVAVRRPGQINYAAGNKKSGAFFALGGIEDDVTAGTVIAGSAEFGRNLDRALIALSAGGGVESVQALMIVAGRILRHGDGIDNTVRP